MFHHHGHYPRPAGVLTVVQSPAGYALIVIDLYATLMYRFLSMRRGGDHADLDGLWVP
jgi:hypothetical protein